jgi:hypothetical protein
MRNFTGISPGSLPGTDAVDFAPRLRNMLSAIDLWARDAAFGLARIEQGQSPNGSGDPIPSSPDLMNYLYKPGRFGGQIVYGGTQAADSLVLFGSAASVDNNPRFMTLTSYATTNIPTVQIADSSTYVSGGPQLLQLLFTGANSAGAGGQIFGIHNTVNSDDIFSVSGYSTGTAILRTGGIVLTGTGTGSVVTVLSVYPKVSTSTGISVTGGTNQSAALISVNAAVSGQVGHLQDWKDSSGSIITWIALDGTLHDTSGFTPAGAALLAAANTFTTKQTITPATDIEALILNANIGGTVAPLIVNTLAGAHPGQLFSVGADGSTAGKCVRLTRLSDGEWNEITGGKAPVFRNSAGNIMLTLNSVAAYWTDTKQTGEFRLGDSFTSFRAGAFLGQGGNLLDRLSVSSAYTLFTNTITSNLPVPVGQEMVRISNSTVTGGADTRVLLRLDSLRAGQSGDYLQIVNSALTTMMSVNSAGSLGLTQGAANVAAILTLHANASTTTGNLLEVYNPSGAVGLFVDCFGVLTSAGLNFIDPVSGFPAVINTATLTIGRSYTFPNADGNVLISGNLDAVAGNTSSRFQSTSTTVGAYFVDSTTTTKRLRMVLSGATSNNSFTFTNSLDLCDWNFKNYGGLVPVVGANTSTAARSKMVKVDLTAQGAAIGSTNMTSTATAGLYEVAYSLEDTTSDVTAGTIQFQVNYTDDIGATSQAGATVALTGAGTIRDQSRFTLYLASGELSYQTNAVGIFGTSKYALRVRVTYLG